MKAIILAAGKSTRLLPLTKDIPQCMLKVGNKTILEIQLKNLKKWGIEDVTVITGYLSEKLEKFCKDLGIKTLFNPFYEVSGMAITLWIARENLKNGFIALYSDVLFDSKIIQGLLKDKSDICLAIKRGALREEAEKIVEKDGKIDNVGKSKSNEGSGEFIGIAKFSSKGVEKLIKELNNTAKINLNASFTEVINNLVKKGEIIKVYDIKNTQFSDIDFPDDLEKAKETFT